MTRRLVLTTALKTRDAVAATADYTLRHDMGYEGVLWNVQREDYWCVELDDTGTPGNFESIMKDLAEKTRVFVNPNKHRYFIKPEGSIRTEPDPEKAGRYLVPVLVRSVEDRAGENALKTLHALYQVGKTVLTIESGVLWTLDIRAGSAEEARGIADKIAVTHTRLEGLLANPHYESVKVL